MEKSCFLDFILKTADKFYSVKTKCPVTADSFVALCLAVIVDRDKVSLPEGAGVISEFMSVRRQFIKKSVVFDEAYGQLTSALDNENVEPGTFSVDSFIFNKLMYEAENEAVKNGETTLTASRVLEAVLAKPGPAFKKYFDDFEAVKKEECAACSDAVEKVENPYEEFDELTVETNRGAEEAKEERLEAERKVAGLKSLLGSVGKVKNIQKTLFERIYGQDNAVTTFVEGVFQAELVSLTKLKRSKPRATYLFAGPPGVGKTFLAEQAAEVLDLPYKRFDMSEYADKEANIEFCGSDKVYKNGKSGNITSFVAEHPKCILLFDEIEKAHLVVIHLFLQLLDAGRLRDNFTDEEVSFKDAILIFTTNAGRQLYEDPSVSELSSVSRKTVLQALGKDKNPVTGAPLFPQAICSRFASGNVLMFNHLGASHLLKIVDKEINNHARAFGESTGISFEIDKKLSGAIMFSEGGKADARAVSGKASNFLYRELYELFRLMASEKNNFDIEKLRKVKIGVELPDDENIRKLFAEASVPELLLFAEGKTAEECVKKLSGFKVRVADTVESAKEILFNNDISVILLDVRCNSEERGGVLNIEDVRSAGRDFFEYAGERVNLPLYIIQNKEGDISPEEFTSFAGGGASALLTVRGGNFAHEVREKCNNAYMQYNLLELAKANKVVSFKTLQKISKNGETASINLFDFKQATAVDAEDNKNILGDVSRPDKHFADVIGAEDAKDELAYFVNYLKNPKKFLRKGVKPPKGILLYGPPGTGKTLLAKAMAGESDVTFIATEGNRFLQRFVGDGAQLVHDIFRTARKYAPSILFIDEIDVIAKERKGEGKPTADDVLTALLTEMDGFNVDTDKPVFVLAATNFGIETGTANSLDGAVLRRFDRKIYVDLPNKEERERFINALTAKSAAFTVDGKQIGNIALRSAGMSLAELEQVCELALRNAIKTKDCSVDNAALEEAFESYNSGEVKKWNPATLERTARHEAGHALMCWLGGETPSYLTIVARGGHGGYMQHGESEDKGLYTKTELLSRIKTALGGRASEIVFYGETDGVSTGASGDLFTATKVAEQLLCNYGMDGETGLSYVSLKEAAGSPYYGVLRERVNGILRNELENAVREISENKSAVNALVEVLLERNHMRGEEIDEILSKFISK